MQHYTVPISGMHCRSCELLISDSIRQVPGVASVRVKYSKSCAVIGYEEAPPDDIAIEEAIRNAGYSVGTAEKAPWLSRNLHDYKNLGLAALILLALYFLARSTGLLDVSVTSDNLSLPFAVVIGLVAGVSTCMAVVGGLVLGLSARYGEQHPEATRAEKFRPHLYFNLGRILGYALLGGLLGALGGFLKLSNIALAILTVGVGVVMVMLGLKLTSISPRLKNASITLPSSISRFFGLSKGQTRYSNKSALLTGGLTFFLPCGFTQAMQLYAISTGSFALGAGALGLFALGTAPALLSMGGISSVLKGVVARRFYVTVGLAVLLFGIFNVRNGFAITGLTSGGASNGKAAVPATDVVDGYQIIRMKQKAAGYSPNSFTVQKGVPVRWIITSESSYSCAASLIMPSYKISKNLEPGENIIEFTPTKTGRIPFSCSMGMYRGSFTVVEKGSAPDTALAQPSSGRIAFTPKTRSAGSAVPSEPVEDPSPPSACGSGGCGCGAAKPTQLPTDGPAAEIDGDLQRITTRDASGPIEPSAFRVKTGIPVEWTVTADGPPVGCMTAFLNRELGIQVRQSTSGNTVIRFTPEQPGNYDVTCGMGMWRGTIIVN